MANENHLPEKSPISSTISPENTINEKWVAALFKKFQARYGHKWTSAIEGIEQIAVQEWTQGLADLDAEDIRRGMATWNGDWPPSLPEFQKACQSDLEPESNEEWRALGESRGIYAGPGESWENYIRRIQRDDRDRRFSTQEQLRLERH